jgi:hypothetical protein
VTGYDAARCSDDDRDGLYRAADGGDEQHAGIHEPLLHDAREPGCVLHELSPAHGING